MQGRLCTEASRERAHTHTPVRLQPTRTTVATGQRLQTAAEAKSIAKT